MKTLLILHGWGSRAENWSRVKELLENQGYKVFVPDLPGFGENSPLSRAWTIDDYVEWVSDFCEKNNLSQFFLLGHSFGGAIAIKFIDKFPEKVQSLILVAPKIRQQKTSRYYLGLILAKLGKLIFSLPGLSFFQPLAKKMLYWAMGTRDYYKLDIEKTIIMKETFKKVVKEDVTSYLSKIKTPTLIIWGSRDKITPTKDAHLINREITSSKLEIIEGGHVPNLEMPEILAKKVLNFIKDL